MRCAKHDVETVVSCGRCETPVCPKCMVHSDVGVRCKNCAPDKGRSMAMNGSVIGVGALVLVGLVVAGAVGSGALGNSNDNPYGDLSGYYDDLPVPDYEIAVNDIADPWSGADAPDGYRLVAINVTITAGEESEYPYYASAFDFTLIDNEDYAYQPIEDGEQPMLPYGVDLEPGQKTRGWITFEVDEDNDLKALTNYGNVIPLDGRGD